MAFRTKEQAENNFPFLKPTNWGYRQDRLEGSRCAIGHGSLKNGKLFFGLFLSAKGGL